MPNSEPSEVEVWLTHEIAKRIRKKIDDEDRELIEGEGIGLPIGLSTSPDDEAVE